MVAAAWVASLFAGSVLGMIQLRRFRSQHGQLQTEYSFLQSAAVGFRAYSVNMLAFLHLRIDVYLVAYYLSPHDLGLYAVAVGLAELVTQLPAVFGTVVFSKSANEAGQEVGGLVAQVVKLIPAMALLAIPAFWLLGRHVITILYGGEFAESYRAALWLLPGVVFLGGTNVINNFLAGKGYPWFLHIACFASLGLNVVLNLAWIPRYRIIGASLASSVSYGLWFLVLLTYFYAHFGQRYASTAASA
jgi:O-antigen/teichoic acid export membrane protein